MLTFVRTSELLGAKWAEIDFENAEWVIPAERMKMKRQHIVPLSKQALIILQEMMKINGKREWVFASQSKPRLHMSNGTILTALKRMGYRGRMTGHGFRALAMSTIKEKLGYRHEVVDRQLAHAPANKVDAAYDRAKFLDDRKTMMQAWADYLDNIKYT
jgi:integrase